MRTEIITAHKFQSAISDTFKYDRLSLLTFQREEINLSWSLRLGAVSDVVASFIKKIFSYSYVYKYFNLVLCFIPHSTAYLAEIT